MWSWTSIEQQTFKSTFATALPNIANALFFILGGDFSEGSIACHFHVGAAFPKYFLAAWLSVKFCGTLCCRKCHSLLPWEKPPHLAYIYLPFLFAILLKAAVAIFSPWIHFKSSNSLLLKCIVSTVSASIATKLLPHTSSFSGAWNWPFSEGRLRTRFWAQENKEGAGQISARKGAGRVDLTSRQGSERNQLSCRPPQKHLMVCSNYFQLPAFSGTAEGPFCPWLCMGHPALTSNKALKTEEPQQAYWWTSNPEECDKACNITKRNWQCGDQGAALVLLSRYVTLETIWWLHFESDEALLITWLGFGWGSKTTPKNFRNLGAIPVYKSTSTILIQDPKLQLLVQTWVSLNDLCWKGP